MSEPRNDRAAELVSEPYLLDAEAAQAYRLAAQGPPRRAPRKGIHDDQEAARRAGFGAPIAAGEQTYAVLASFLADRFGMGFLRGGRLEVSFVKPVLFGDTLTCHARATNERDGARELEVWVANQRGERVATGTARVGL